MIYNRNRFQRPAPCGVGDRVQLVGMAPNDPCPIPNGATGTATALNDFGDGTWKVSVTWDAPNDKRSLSLIYPADSFTVLQPSTTSAA